MGKERNHVSSKKLRKKDLRHKLPPKWTPSSSRKVSFSDSANITVTRPNVTREVTVISSQSGHVDHGTTSSVSENSSQRIGGFDTTQESIHLNSTCQSQFTSNGDGPNSIRSSEHKRCFQEKRDSREPPRPKRFKNSRGECVSSTNVSTFHKVPPLEQQQMSSNSSVGSFQDETNNNAITTVFVSGFEEATTDETIYSFFESKEQSGGGELTEFRRTGPSEACLTFKYSKDAENVLEKSDQLRFGHFPLRITTSRERTNEKNVLLVDNLSSDTSEESLRNYMISGKEVGSLVSGKNNDALICLKEDTAIKITNIPSSATKDDIIDKFENVNRGGGRVSELMLDKKNGIANVFFEDYSEKMKPETTRFSIGTNKNKSIFLNSIEYSKKLMIEFPRIQIGGPDISSGEIMCMGTKKSLEDVKVRILQDVQAITETRLKMSRRQIEFLKRNDCQVVNNEFKRNDTNAMLYLKSLKASGSAQTLQATLMTLKIHDGISNLRNIVLNLTSEKRERVDETTGRFLAKSDRMSKFQQQQYERHGVMVELADSGGIWIVGKRSKVSSAVQEAKMFTTANKIITAPLKIDHIQARFLASYRAKDITEGAKGLSKEGVKIEFDGSTGSIVVSGTQSGRKQAIELLQSLSDKVVSKDFEIKAPGIRKQMKLDSTKDMIFGIEKKNECIIERINAQKGATAATIENVPTANKVIPKTATSTSFYENVSVISSKEIRVKGGKKISVVIGDLSLEKVDVIVNTTNDKLDLKGNPCGKALLDVAGKELQDECRKIGSLPIGKMAMTKQGKLNCKHVYHVNCAAWNNGKGETVLRDILKICLNKIDFHNFRSIAIPAIGTGNLNFPHSVVAKIFFEEVLNFLTSNPQTILKDVRFVAYHRDPASIDAFLGEIKSMKPISSVAVREFGDEVMYTHSGLLKSIKSRDGHLDVFLDKDVKVQIVQGDITKESTELIMHVTNCELSLQGGVAQSLTRVGGDVVAEECKAMLPVDLFSVHFTGAGKLSVPKIAHVVAPDGPTEADLAKCLEKFLTSVKERKIQQISFCAIGAGAIGLSEKVSANLIIKALTKHLTNENSTLKLIRIVIFEKQKFEKFKNAVEVFTKIGDAADGQPCIRIHAWDASIIDKTWNEFKSKMEEHIVTKNLPDPNIKKFSKEEIREIERLTEIHDVEINVKRDEGVVKIRGHSTDITEVQHKIFEMIKKKMSHEHIGSSVQLPDYWDLQPKETKVHKVTLQITSSEYKKISDHFLKTARSVQIQKIERIQNPSIYKMYAQKRKSMDEKNGSNEQMLFHGTYRAVLDSINNGGLNRSFAGRNATAFGKGVYFARDASYSCQSTYSPTDDQGLRYVYYARVLVGEYTRGESSMIVPPPKSSSDPNEKYDSVVDNINNPGIFVLFHDYESYTEYLITFK